MAAAPGLAADREAVEVGQADVEHDDGGLVALDGREPGRAGRRELDVVAGVRQLDLEHAGDRRVVLDHQHALFREVPRAHDSDPRASSPKTYETLDERWRGARPALSCRLLR